MLSSVTASGRPGGHDSSRAPRCTYFYYIADQIGIVDQNVWSKVANPVTYPDKNPVGTGAYTMTRCTPQNITYTANKHYWQPGLPKVETVNYPAFLTNDTANTFLANGQAQWGSQFIPSIKQFYLAKNPDYHYWFPPVANVTLFPNLTNPLLKNLAVRQAMSYAINRPKASTIGEYGYEPGSNQAGIVTPTFSSLAGQLAGGRVRQQLRLQPGQGDLDPGARRVQARLQRHLQHARQASRCRSPSSTTAGSPTGWPRCRRIMARTSRRSGSSSRPDNLAPTDLRRPTSTPASSTSPTTPRPAARSPYYELRQWLYAAELRARSAQPAGSELRAVQQPGDGRADQPVRRTTTDPATQHSIVNQLQKVMLTDVPVIPITEAVDWFQYDTGSFSGWPTRVNQYAQPAAYNYPDWGQVMLRLLAGEVRLPAVEPASRPASTRSPTSGEPP